MAESASNTTFASFFQNDLMKRLLSASLLAIHVLSLHAQADSIKHDKEEIHISKNFLKELDATFSFPPLEAELKKPSGLTIEQLHEWVGKPNLPEQKRDTTKYTREYVTLKIYLHDLQPFPPPPVPEIDWKKYNGRNHHGENGHYYKDTHTTLNGCSVGGFDFNKIASYIRPKEIQLRKARESADRCRKLMDRVFPASGEPLYSKEDTQRPDTASIQTKEH